MTEYIKEYEKVLKVRLSKKGSVEKLDEWIEYHKIQIEHLQHERTIHLFVTLNFGIFFLMSILAFLIIHTPDLILLAGLFFVLLVPYIFHYYFLENTTQRWYGFEKMLFDKRGSLKK